MITVLRFILLYCGEIPRKRWAWQRSQPNGEYPRGDEWRMHCGCVDLVWPTRGRNRGRVNTYAGVRSLSHRPARVFFCKVSVSSGFHLLDAEPNVLRFDFCWRSFGEPLCSTPTNHCVLRFKGDFNSWSVPSWQCCCFEVVSQKNFAEQIWTILRFSCNFLFLIQLGPNY